MSVSLDAVFRLTVLLALFAAAAAFYLIEHKGLLVVALAGCFNMAIIGFAGASRADALTRSSTAS